jgi:uncharacterized membrane protein YphA (DoxX/SURF4 family)
VLQGEDFPVTEPREPEATPDDGETTRPIERKAPEASAWYLVESARPEAAQPAAEPPVPEAIVAEAAGEPPAVEPPVAEEIVAEEAVAEVPVAEEPVAEEPVAEEPVAEEPVAAAPVEEPAGDEPLEEVPAVEVPAVVAPAVVEPVAEAVTVEGHPAEEPTVATDVAAEETVALEPRPLAAGATSVLAVGELAELLPSASAPTEAIFRQPSPNSSPESEPTRAEQLSEEEQKLAAERAARRDARAAALAASAPVALVAPEPVTVHHRTNDKFWGSVGLFLLRLVLAAIFAVRGLNLLTDIPAAQAMFAKTIIPEPGIMAIVTGVAALLIALSLVLGLLTRAAGLGIALIGGGALVFFFWGNWSPFVPGRAGFLGDFELLLAAVGILLLCIGAGGWSLDRSIRAGRERDKAERSAAGA